MLEHAGSRSVEEREINARPFSAKELDALIGDADYIEYLNPRNELYRERDMKTKPPARGEALKLIENEPNLMKRPILIAKGRKLLGFDEAAWKGVLKG